MRVARVVVVALALLASSRLASAQGTSAPLARFITDLLASGARVDTTASVELGDFVVAQGLGGLPAMVNQAIGFQLATTPFDMGFETSKLSFESVPTQYGFGPSFSIRAGALGRGRTSVSFNYQNVSFGWLDGIGLKSADMGFVLRPPTSVQSRFGRDLVYEALKLRLSQDVATFGLVYGVSDRLDVGVGVPVIHLEMEGQVRSQVFGSIFTLTPRPPTVPADAHFFDVYPATPGAADGCSSTALDVQGVQHAPSDVALFDMVELAQRTITRKCKASGLGDLVGHLRYRVNASESNALAVSVNASIPTGDADNLLGANGSRVNGSVAWTGRSGRFLPHASAGYTIGLGDSTVLFNQVAQCTASNPQAPATRATTCATVTSPTPLDLKLPAEINFAGGTDMVFWRHLTIAADLFARRISDLNTFRVNPTTDPALLPGDPQVPGPLLQVKSKGATLIVGMAAAQVALTNRTVLKANMLIPMRGAVGDGLGARWSFGAGLGVRY
jgi:hypothetical protein